VGKIVVEWLGKCWWLGSYLPQDDNLCCWAVFELARFLKTGLLCVPSFVTQLVQGKGSTSFEEAPWPGSLPFLCRVGVE